MTTSIENIIEKSLFASRWLLAPIYLGLAASLLLLVMVFMKELWHLVVNFLTLTQGDVILGMLSLIDLSLAGNLLLIVIYSGYENFVSKMNTVGHEDRPDWKGSVDFSGLKLKLIASMVAISGIHLLKVFMEIGKTPENHIFWMIVIHTLFIASGVLLALMDHIATSAKAMKK